MIPRYTRPEMAKIWDERNEWQTMLDVEIAACEANAELGRIPKEAVEVIKAKADLMWNAFMKLIVKLITISSRSFLPSENMWAMKRSTSIWA